MGTDEERDTWERLKVRPVFVICPSCRLVIRRVTERAESPTAITRIAPEPCATCQRGKAYTQP